MNRRNLLKSLFALPFVGLAGKMLAKDEIDKRPDIRKSPYKIRKIYLNGAFLNENGLPIANGTVCVNKKCVRTDLHEAPVMCMTNMYFG